MINADRIFIDASGALKIQREDETISHSLYCPFHRNNHSCGNWCPHFGNIRRNSYGIYRLELSCGGDEAYIDAKEFGPPDHLAEFKNIMDEAHVDYTNVHWENPPEVEHVK